MDLERDIVLHLFNSKFQLNSTEWRASDDRVLNQIHAGLNASGKWNMSLDQIKQHVNELEERIKRHKERTEEIVQDKDVMLQVFDYVTPEQTTEVFPASSIKKVKRTSYPASPSHSNDSVSKQFSKLMEGPFSMACCAEKLQKLGFKSPELFNAIEMLKSDIEARQVFIVLDSTAAKEYVLRLLDKF